LYKVRIEKNNCYCLISPNGIRTLSGDKNIPQYDQFAKSSIRFAKENLLQRDVEIEAVACTPKGIINANLIVNKKNFALNLLESGLAYVDGQAKLPGRFAVEMR